MQLPDSFPSYCPTCGSQIAFSLALCGRRQLDAVLLQSDRLGVEIACQTCGQAFIFSRVESMPRLRQHRDAESHQASPTRTAEVAAQNLVHQ